MAGEVVQKESSGKKKGLRRPKRRIPIRIDMTPMVDIAFLLLIFYMVTTVFAMPQAMEINLPPKDDNTQEERVKVKESNLMRLYVDKNNDFYYQIGGERQSGQDIKVPWAIPADSVRSLLYTYAKERYFLNTLVLIHPDAVYSRMVDVLDEIEVVEDALRRDETFMQAYLAEMKAKEPDIQRYSFRYSIDHWGERQNKMFDEKVYGQRGGGE